MNRLIPFLLLLATSAAAGEILNASDAEKWARRIEITNTVPHDPFDNTHSMWWAGAGQLIEHSTNIPASKLDLLLRTGEIWKKIDQQSAQLREIDRRQKRLHRQEMLLFVLIVSVSVLGVVWVKDQNYQKQ